MVSFQDTEWKVFPRFLPAVRSTLLLGKDDSRSRVEIKNISARDEATLERQSASVRSSSLGRKLDPALKSWMDNVIIPALVREYLAEIEKRNRLATTGAAELTSNKDGDEP
jgi:hypothetical protein